MVLFGVLGVPAIASLIEASKPAAEPTTVSLLAVGDNLPDEYVGYYADGVDGQMDDGHYDYSPIYEPLLPYIQAADLAYVNEETHVGGAEFGPCGYPSFNTTDEMADAIVNAGFDFVASATNHSYDWGLHGALDHSVALWETKPVAFTGTATTKEQYERIVTQERNGITFALLNYTYGVNGFDQASLPEYAVNFIDEKRIAADVGRAHMKADVVIVAMHWGTELLMEADEEQQHWAQFLADLNVDVVLGSHPHVIGPMAWVNSSIHPEHRTLVAYSLGNFLADHESPTPESALEGMMTCDFVRDSDGNITVENVRWVPLICHANQERSGFAIYTVDDYTTQLAAQNRSLAEMSDPITWLNDKSKEVVGSQWFSA